VVSSDFAKRVIGFLPWGPGNGLPKATVPGVAYGNEWWEPARVRFPTKLRVLADGRPQLLAVGHERHGSSGSARRLPILTSRSASQPGAGSWTPS
jgi:hypothetical protein